MNQDRFCKSIYRLLFLSMTAIPAIPLLLSAGIGYYYSTQTTEHLAVSALQHVALDHQKLIARFLEERKKDLESLLANTSPARLCDHGELVRMKQVLGSAFNDLGTIGPDGIQAAYAGEHGLAGRDYNSAPWYREAVRNGYYISDIYLGYRNIPHFVIAVAKRIDGRQWVLRGTIDSDEFGRLVEGVNVGDSGEAYILDSQSRFQTRRRSGGELLEKDAAHYPPQEKSIMTFVDDEGDVSYLTASALLNDGKWRLIVRQKREDAFHSTHTAALAIAAVLLVGGVFIVGLAFLVSRRIVDSFRRQAESVCTLENQLFQAARLAELGEMSTGFAHEINNPLQIMKTDLALQDLLLRDLDEASLDPETRAELLEIAEQFKIQIERCAGITKEILRFGRPDAPNLQPVDLKEYLPGIGAMVEKKAAVNGVDLRFELRGPVPVIQADPGQLQQVMINLLNNAIHAVVDRHGASGGEITVSAHGDAQGNAVVDVEDNGTGISEDGLKKIFLPFYTTKAPGEGTGMGLPVCHSIIDSLGGQLLVQSKKGEGTRFTILVPGISEKAPA
ncbi:sensor histidine kinase [Salidesulfovibrio onnuriiensis]|uniref:sensor histidine kinase n=1 Tax=Salidesulfovibrio onnuriiensis TaxID=2583823 RepID=UPI0011CB6C26|nr:PAS domain-containing sensor histidine kinase [Salidesulfovibrio onnuriiensis]